MRGIWTPYWSFSFFFFLWIKEYIFFLNLLNIFVFFYCCLHFILAKRPKKGGNENSLAHKIYWQRHGHQYLSWYSEKNKRTHTLATKNLFFQVVSYAYKHTLRLINTHLHIHNDAKIKHYRTLYTGHHQLSIYPFIHLQNKSFNTSIQYSFKSVRKERTQATATNTAT